MPRGVTQSVLIVPLLTVSGLVGADGGSPRPGYAGDPFSFDATELDSIRFTRSENQDLGVLYSSGSMIKHGGALAPVLTRQTEVSFKLKPKRPEFSKQGAYGLDLFSDPRLAVRSSLVGLQSTDEQLTGLHQGFEYSAGLTIEHEDEQIDGTAYVSSGLLGLSYGRLGRLWYGGFDVNLEQFTADDIGDEPSDILSLDVTTGRRLGFTGLDADSPLWLLSVQGNVDVKEWENGDDLESSSAWYLNPSLFWQQPGFTFSAQMQVPVEFETLDDEGQPDYRLRAVFKKQFK